MPNERRRIVVDDPYLVAVGRCAFIFSQLEWNVIWCGQKIAPGFLANAARRTAGGIGRAFEPLAKGLQQGPVQDRCIAAAQEFRRLVEVRNGIAHAKPCTARTGEQRLVRDGNIWTIAELEAVADQFAVCSIELNDLFRHWLP